MRNSIYILTISMTWNLNEWRNTCWSLIKTSAMYFQPCPARHLQSNFQKTLVCLSPLRIAERGSQSLKPAKCINMPHMDTYWWFNYGSKSKTRKATGLSLCLHSITHPISSNYWGYPTLENTFLGPRSISFGPGHFSWTLLKFFWRWLPFFWTCAPSRWTCAPSCWTWPFPKPRPLWIDSPSCVLVAILQTVEG